MRRLIFGLLGLIVLVVVVVVGAAAFLDMGFLKSRIVEAARDATGRDFAIDGPLSIKLLPEFRLVANDVHLSNLSNLSNSINKPGLEPADMVAFDSLSLVLDVMPLLQKKIVLKSLVLTNPSIALEVDANGRPNWVFDTPRSDDGDDESVIESDDGDAADSLESDDLPNIEIHDLRIEGGRFSFADAASGQTVLAEDIQITVAMPSMDDPLSVNGALMLNGKPVTMQLSVDEPGRAATGGDFILLAALAAENINASIKGKVLQTPVPGIDGVVSLDVPSVGALAAWLGKPLGSDQPDPGPLKITATLTADGTSTVIKQASIEGQSIALTIDGNATMAGGKRSIVLNIVGGVLDLDPYLPPETRMAEGSEANGGVVGGGGDRGDDRPRRDAMVGDGPSDQPFDLEMLRNTEADISIAVDGIKARAFRSGPIDLGVILRDGKLNADLRQFALLDGNVTGTVALDGSTDTLAIDAAVTVDAVRTEGVATKEDGAPLTGVVSAALTAKGAGATPRALMESITAHIELALGGIEAEGAVAQLSEAAFTLDIQGADSGPTGTGHVVYNDERIDLAIGLGTMRDMHANQRVDADIAITSRLFETGYQGAIQMHPVPGLDGTLNLTIPSVGALAAWAGSPLPEGQPDPGEVAFTAKLGAEGETVTIDEARLTGEALDATLTGRATMPATGPASFELNATLARLDLDRYLPPPADTDGEEAGAPAAAGDSADTGADAPARGWPDDPIDFSGLHAANGTVSVTIGEIIYRGLAISSGRFGFTLDGGIATTSLKDLLVSEGSVSAGATVDASGDVPRLSYDAAATGVAAKPLLTALSGVDRLSGTAEFSASGETAGHSVKDLVGALNGEGRFQFLDGAIEGVNLAEILRNVGTLGMGDSGGETPKTDFSELSGSFVIANGVIDNRDLKMLAPLVRLSGGGVIPMPPQTIDYTATATLVASLEGQGGTEGLAGLPIPVHLTGPWSAVNYELDWGAALREAAKDPERLRQLPQKLLGEAGNLGIELPFDLEGGDGLGSVIESLPEQLENLIPGQEGGGEPVGALLDGLKNLVNPGAAQTTAPDDTAPAPAEGAPAPEEAAPKALDPLDALQNLLNR